MSRRRWAISSARSPGAWSASRRCMCAVSTARASSRGACLARLSVTSMRSRSRGGYPGATGWSRSASIASRCSTGSSMRCPPTIRCTPSARSRRSCKPTGCCGSGWALPQNDSRTSRRRRDRLAGGRGVRGGTARDRNRLRDPRTQRVLPAGLAPPIGRGLDLLHHAGRCRERAGERAVNRALISVGRILLTLAFVAAAIVALVVVWRRYEDDPWTRDGKVRADSVQVAADVSGLVTQILVHDNEYVRAGQVLFVVDRERYSAALAQADAAVARAQAALDDAVRERGRYVALGDLVSRELRDQHVTAVEVDRAALAQAI